MLRPMPNHARQLDPVFKALADPTRRAVLERLSRGPAGVSDLARPFKMALPSFAQHLAVLERSGLVKSQKQGRVRTYKLVPRRIREAENWLARRRKLWETRLDQLDRFLKNDQENDA